MDGPEPRHGSVLVGRRRELATLADALDDALDGRGRLVLLAGEPGIGKSRVADELASIARERGCLVLWGRCWEAGGAPAYWPWVQSLRTYLRDTDRETLRSQLGAHAAELARMLPEIREIQPDVEPLPSGDPDAARFRLFDSTMTFLRNIAIDRPIVLVLDDLHAADTPSLMLLRFVASELPRARILIVGAYRDTEVRRDQALMSTVSELVRERSTRVVELRGLSEPDVSSYIQQTSRVVPPATLVSAVHRETEGNPLFVGEVIRLLAQEGLLDEAPLDIPRLGIPQGMQEVIGRRLGFLSEAGHRLLALAAVIGREFDVEILSSLSGLGGDDVLDLLDEAVRARIVTEVPGAPGRARFAHALIRDVLYEELGRSARVRLHRQVGEVLERIYAHDPEPHLAELSHHFFEAAPAGEVELAISYARRAGARAIALLAHEEAVRHFGSALRALEMKPRADERERCELLVELGEALARSGDGPKARETFLEAAAIAKRTGMPERLAEAALGYGGRFVWSRARGDTQLVALLEAALSALPDEETPLRARILARLAGALRDQPSPQPRMSYSREAVRIARALGDPSTLAYALAGRASVLWRLDTIEERIEVATELVQVGLAVGDLERAMDGYGYRYIALLELGRLPEAYEELRPRIRLAEELRQPAQLWLIEVARATLALLQGRLVEAEERARKALALGERAHRSDATFFHLIGTFTLRKEQGRLDEVASQVEGAARDGPENPVLQSLLANLCAELGRATEARELLAWLAADGFASLPLDNEGLYGSALAAETIDAFGDARMASVLYDRLRAYAHLTVSPGEVSLGSFSRFLGLLAGTISRWDDAVRHFEAAIEMNERLRALPFVARTQHELARALTARGAPGDQERANELLFSALETARKLGMATLERRCAQLQGGTLVGETSSASGPAAFRREGEYFSVVFEGETCRLRDSKGMRHLTRLLAEPEREFHALDLVMAEEGTAEAPATREAERGAGISSGGADAVLDARAKAEYIGRIADLEQELAEARSWHDPERETRAREELEFLTRELAGAVGLGGRDRRAATASERARVNVTRAIRTAMDRIEDSAPALGKHLRATIRTGTFCSYRPDPRAPVSWRL